MKKSDIIGGLILCICAIIGGYYYETNETFRKWHDYMHETARSRQRRTTEPKIVVDRKVTSYRRCEDAEWWVERIHPWAQVSDFCDLCVQQYAEERMKFTPTYESPVNATVDDINLSLDRTYNYTMLGIRILHIHELCAKRWFAEKLRLCA